MSSNAVSFFDVNQGETKLSPYLADQDINLDQEMFSEPLVGGIVGQSAALRHILDLVETVAPSDSTVILLGETGTGKELMHAPFTNSAGGATGPS